MNRTPRVCVWLTAAILVPALLFVSLALPVRRESTYVCERTGSTRHRVTWLWLVERDAFSPSSLETFIQSRAPAILDHKWRWTDATQKNLLGQTGIIEDGFTPASWLSGYVRGIFFADLSDGVKMKVYELLKYASEHLSDDEKADVYGKLLDSVGERTALDLVKKYEDGAKGSEKAPVKTGKE